jgi:peptidoglycan/LPS O-acetylase OafA/YrhL
VLAAIAWRNDDVKRWLGEHAGYFKMALWSCIAIWTVMLPWTTVKFSYLAHTVSLSTLGFLYLSLMITVLLDGKSWLGRIFRWRALREVGRISYCVYLIHLPVLWVLHRLLLGGDPRFDNWPAIGLTVAAFAATLLIAELSWRYFEHPLIRRGHAFKY